MLILFWLILALFKNSFLGFFIVFIVLLLLCFIVCLIQTLESNSPPTESEGGEWYLTFVDLGTEAKQHHPVCKRATADLQSALPGPHGRCGR